MNDTLLIRVSREFFEMMLTRDAEGNRLRVTWPEGAVEYASAGEPIFEPTVTVDRTDNPFRAREVAVPDFGQQFSRRS